MTLVKMNNCEGFILSLTILFRNKRIEPNVLRVHTEVFSRFLKKIKLTRLVS